MASIRKRGENSYLLVVSRGYDYQGNRLKPAQKTVHLPLGLTTKQTQKWLNEQAVLYEQEVKHTPVQLVDSSITLAKYIEIWLEQVAPKKLAASTRTREKQDLRRILPVLGHYKLTELNKEPFRDFYDAMRRERSENTGDPLAEGAVESIHSCLCGILSDAVEAGHITHNPAWRAYKKKDVTKEPKTRAGVRVVYLPKDMCKLLRAWEKECQWEKEQLGAGEMTRDDYLFHQPNGDPMMPCTFTYRLKMILRENGLPDDLNVHSLRHPYVKHTTKR